MDMPQAIDIADATRFNTPPIELQDLAPATESARIQQAFRFAALPPELRLDIIERIVISPSTITWQGSYIGDNVQHLETNYRHMCNGAAAYLPPRYNIASFLLADRALFNQAAPVFYGKNTFCFSSPSPGLPLAFTSPLFTTHLHYLIIGSPARGLSARKIDVTDNINSERVAEITQLCPALRSFVTHLPLVSADIPRVQTISLPWYHRRPWQVVLSVLLVGAFLALASWTIWAVTMLVLYRMGYDPS